MNNRNSVVSFLAITVTFIFKKAPLFLGVLFIFSCTHYYYETIYVKIISTPQKTMKGYKYYIDYNNKLDSLYYKDDKLIIGMYYPFTIRKK